jgi:anti-sigma-K factor RskA
LWLIYYKTLKTSFINNNKLLLQSVKKLINNYNKKKATAEIEYSKYSHIETWLRVNSKVELKEKARTQKNFSSHRCNHWRVIANFSTAITVQCILNSNLLSHKY